jgi:hypothetical protein
MADGATTNLALVLPEVGASADTWGAKLNSNFIDLDALFDATGANLGLDHLPFGTARQLLQTNAGATAAEYTSNVDVPGTLDVTGATTLDGTLGVTGAVTLASTLGVTGAATLSSTLGVTGATTLSATLAVTGAATLSSTLSVAGTVSLTAASGLITSNTADGSDTKGVALAGGGALSSTRGAYFTAFGNEHATLPGLVQVAAGNVTGAVLQLMTAGTERLAISHAGAVTIPGTLGVTGAVTLTDTLAWGGGAAIASSDDLTDNEILTGTTTWQPGAGTVNANEGVQTTVAVVGAAVGDLVVVAQVFQADVSSLISAAWVTSADLVGISVRNVSGTNATTTSRAQRVFVIKA